CLAAANSSGDAALTAARSAHDAAQQAGSASLIDKAETLVLSIRAVQEHGTQAMAAMSEARHALREAVSA
ncbi:MAG: hypothetical protein ACRDT8_21055, partial [Micromonosporaceae bacterium]